MTTVNLNQGQAAFADAFFSFLFTPEPEMILSGGGGVGKTFMINYAINEILPRYFESCRLMGIPPEYDSMDLTATTNKATDVLSVATGLPALTTHSFFGLRVKEDYKTGVTTLTPTNAWRVHERKVIIVDEASMTDSQLRGYIHKGTHKSKILYVGDHCQMNPVMEKISPVFSSGAPIHILTEPVRNAEQPALMAVCNQLRQTVETGVFNPIRIVPGVIDLLDNNGMAHWLEQEFIHQTTSSRILAYTNRRVIELNDHIRWMRQLPDQLTPGEILVNNNSMEFKDKRMSVESEYTVYDVSPITEDVQVENGVYLTVRPIKLTDCYGDILHVRVPEDKEHFLALIAHYGKAKNFERMYWLKKTFPDLRPRDAATVYKAQGSTYNSVFIDLENISSCRQPDQVARMLYVAFSRPRNRIFLYGDLASKYGGLIY